MAEDRLKEFIREHREAFNTEKAPSRVWDRVEKDLGQAQNGKTVSLRNLWYIIGSLVVIATLTGVLIWNFGSQPTETNIQYASIPDTEYQELQKHYVPLLESKEERFVQNVGSQTVIEELTELDKGFKELEMDYINSKAANKEMMLRLMKENYELRIQILEMAMNKIKMDAKEKQEFDEQLKGLKNEY